MAFEMAQVQKQLEANKVEYISVIPYSIKESLEARV
jgi:hypothetical protein